MTRATPVHACGGDGYDRAAFDSGTGPGNAGRSARHQRVCDACRGSRPCGCRRCLTALRHGRPSLPGGVAARRGANELDALAAGAVPAALFSSQAPPWPLPPPDPLPPPLPPLSLLLPQRLPCAGVPAREPLSPACQADTATPTGCQRHGDGRARWPPSRRIRLNWPQRSPRRPSLAPRLGPMRRGGGRRRQSPPGRRRVDGTALGWPASPPSPIPRPCHPPVRPCLPADGLHAEEAPPPLERRRSAPCRGR